jgi:predicted PurR-regulated permease PerM
MEIVILISVLATLGIVAVVGAVVVMFNKLNNKVDRRSYEENIVNLQRELGNVIAEFDNKIDDTNNNIHREMEGNYDALDGRINEAFHFTDSRCDKLHQEFVTKPSK